MLVDLPTVFTLVTHKIIKFYYKKNNIGTYVFFCYCNYLEIVEGKVYIIQTRAEVGILL